jgi:peptide/nickel transport system permease protein
MSVDTAPSSPELKFAVDSAAVGRAGLQNVGSVFRRVGRAAGRRLLLLIPTALIASMVNFTVIRLVPGGPAEAKLGIYATPQTVRVLNEDMGLYHPLVYQYVHWLLGAIQGNLGTSLSNGANVTATVARTLPVTLELVSLALIWTFLFAIPTGIIAARRLTSRVDRAITGVSGMGLAVPDFFLAIILIIVFGVKLGLFPQIGYVSPSMSFGENLYHMFLPSLTMGLGAGAIIVRQVRGAMSEALQGDSIRTARAMGLPERKVMAYAFRNALPTILNVYGLLFIGMLGATIIIEQIFNLPGMGSILINSITIQDYTMIEGLLIIYVALVLAVNLVVDVLVSVVAPWQQER